MATSISGGQGNTMLFMFGDGRHGHKLAKVMCECNDEKRVFQCIGIVIDKKFEKHMEDFKRCKTCKIHAIDFEKQKQDPTELERIVTQHRYDWLVMLPAGDHFRPAHVKCVSMMWKKHQGKNVMLLSMAKVEEAEKSPLKELMEAEKCVQECFPQKNVILRAQLALQDLDFFATELKQKRAWRLPIGNQGAFSPICLQDDMACAICHIAKEKNLEERFQNKIFTLTNTRAVTGNQLAEVTRTALGEDVKYEAIGMEEADEILKKFQKQSSDRERGGGNKHHEMNRHLLSDAERMGLLVVFGMIEQGKYNFVTDHAKMITGKEPMSIEDYLREHEENFKPGRA
jgi:hypothetical protein